MWQPKWSQLMASISQPPSPKNQINNFCIHYTVNYYQKHTNKKTHHRSGNILMHSCSYKYTNWQCTSTQVQNQKFLLTRMGNCIVLHRKPVKVMKTDGKIIEYKAPIQVHQVLAQFSHHVIISDKSFPEGKHLHPNAEMLRGHLYHLLPSPHQKEIDSKKKKKKNKVVRFSDDVKELEKPGKVPGFVRIKVVISKQELQALLGQEGVSVEDVISQVQTAPVLPTTHKTEDTFSISSRGWLHLPGQALETIPELD